MASFVRETVKKTLIFRKPAGIPEANLVYDYMEEVLSGL